jgi:hypothetical protein
MISGKENPPSPRKIMLTEGQAFLKRQNNHLNNPKTPLPEWEFPALSCSLYYLLIIEQNRVFLSIFF